MTDYIFAIGERVGIATSLPDVNGYPTLRYSGLVLMQGGSMVDGDWWPGYLVATSFHGNMWFHERDLKEIGL